MRIAIATLLVFLACFAARGSTVITATVTITNVAGTTNGNTLTINSDVRTFTNSVYDAATQIRTATNATLAAQNLLVQVAAHPFTGLSLSASTATSISLRTDPDGASPTITLSTNWGTVSLATNTLGSGVIVRMPLTLESAEVQTNIASALAAAINSSANTNPVTSGQAWQMATLYETNFFLWPVGTPSPLTETNPPANYYYSPVQSAFGINLGLLQAGFNVGGSGPVFSYSTNTVYLFTVDNAGNLSYVNGAGPYAWPTNSAPGAFVNDGSGNLTWTAGWTGDQTIVTNGTDTATLHITNGLIISITAP